MKQNELIQQAIKIIGKPTQGDQDWIIAPTQHARTYQKLAPELAEILSSSNIQGYAKRFEESDQEAVDAQNQFKRGAKQSRTAGTVRLRDPRTSVVRSPPMVKNGREYPKIGCQSSRIAL